MTDQIQVRPARVDDKNAVLAFCQNTFSWGDYVPEVWETWLNDVRGQLLVGEVDQQPVGLIHVAFLDSGAAWLEGMRVHPNFRRQGIGRAVDATARTIARERGARLARLATSTKNLAAQKALAAEGYACSASFNEWEAKPARRDFSKSHVAVETDAAALLERWEASSTRTKSALLPDRHWHWDELTRARLLDQIDAGRVRMVGGGFAFLLAFEERDWSGISLHALAGDEEAMGALALAARGEARYRGFPRLEAILLDHPQVNSALERAGYRRQGGMFIYEQILQ